MSVDYYLWKVSWDQTKNMSKKSKKNGESKWVYTSIFNIKFKKNETVKVISSIYEKRKS